MCWQKNDSSNEVNSFDVDVVRSRDWKCTKSSSCYRRDVPSIMEKLCQLN